MLEIILITYNRRAHLERTLGRFFADDSPFKTAPFTVLDNCSTDGSGDLIQEYCAKYSHIKYIRHPKNIGGNGNIARAMEIARAEYVWIVCDDDNFDWKAWPEIHAAMQSRVYDILLTFKYNLRKDAGVAKIVHQLTFVPAGIYRTANITNGVMQNAMTNIVNLMPHLAITCHVLNKKGKIYVPEGELISHATFDPAPAETLYTKGYDTEQHPLSKNMFWVVGYINSLQMITDKKLRYNIIANAGHHGFFGMIYRRFFKNRSQYSNNSLNAYYVWCGISFWQKMQFAIAYILIDIVCFLSLLNPLKKIKILFSNTHK